MTHAEIVIRGGLICDGTGSEPFAADILLRDGKIAEIGTVGTTDAEVIDAAGCSRPAS